MGWLSQTRPIPRSPDGDKKADMGEHSLEKTKLRSGNDESCDDNIITTYHYHFYFHRDDNNYNNQTWDTP